MNFFLAHRNEISRLTLEHVWLVTASMVLAVAIGVPLGILLSRKPSFRPVVLGANNVIQTVPSLALFGLLLPLPWLGVRADRLTILALTLYALLPIIRNTYAGIEGVDVSMKEAAEGMGLTSLQRLRYIELPLAAPFVLTGIRVATVVTIGVATIAAAIGAGGLGEFIFRGLAMVDNNVILAGAIPAALLALVADVLFSLLERFALRKARR